MCLTKVCCLSQVIRTETNLHKLEILLVQGVAAIEMFFFYITLDLANCKSSLWMVACFGLVPQTHPNVFVEHDELSHVYVKERLILFLGRSAAPMTTP